jgi:putative flippase GtrA
LLLNSGTTWLAAAHGLQPYLAKMMGIGLAFIFNTSANFLVVFRRPAAVRSGFRLQL